jgi:hypothetical protein
MDERVGAARKAFGRSRHHGRADAKGVINDGIPAKAQ